MEGTDVRMIELGDRPGLAVGAVAELRVGGEPVRADL